MTGNKYIFSGKMMPAFKDWALEMAGIDLDNRSLIKKLMVADPPRLNDDFLDTIGDNFSRISFESKERTMHSHGHTLQEIWLLRNGKFPRFVDCVIYPYTTDHVEKIVAAANTYDVVIIPYGGGTNVTKAVMPNPKEERMIVSLDMSRMNKVMHVNKENMTATVQCGILGQDLERELRKENVVCGHEPDSHEFSTLGGWISTKASGMKKNVYGNIEDIIINFTIVTPVGTYTHLVQNYERVS